MAAELDCAHVLGLLAESVPLAEISRRTGLNRIRLRKIRDGIDERRGQVGRPPLAPELKNAIARRLAEGETIRPIAQSLGVSTWSVCRVRTPAPPAAHKRVGPSEKQLSTSTRCPGCGSPILVLPCRVCRARDLRELERAHSSRIGG